MLQKDIVYCLQQAVMISARLMWHRCWEKPYRSVIRLVNDSFW